MHEFSMDIQKVPIDMPQKAFPRVWALRTAQSEGWAMFESLHASHPFYTFVDSCDAVGGLVLRYPGIFDHRVTPRVPMAQVWKDANFFPLKEFALQLRRVSDIRFLSGRKGQSFMNLAIDKHRGDLIAYLRDHFPDSWRSLPIDEAYLPKRRMLLRRERAAHAIVEMCNLRWPVIKNKVFFQRRVQKITRVQAVWRSRDVRRNLSEYVSGLADKKHFLSAWRALMKRLGHASNMDRSTGKMLNDKSWTEVRRDLDMNDETENMDNELLAFLQERKEMEFTGPLSDEPPEGWNDTPLNIDAAFQPNHVSSRESTASSEAPTALMEPNDGRTSSLDSSRTASQLDAAEETAVSAPPAPCAPPTPSETDDLDSSSSTAVLPKLDNVKWTKDVLKWFMNSNPRYKEYLRRRLEQLSTDNSRGRTLRKRLVGSKYPIYETYLDQHTAQRILWTECREGEKVGILIWFVSTHDRVSRRMTQVDEMLNRLIRQSKLGEKAMYDKMFKQARFRSYCKAPASHRC
jgi:hypothetical protein